MMNPCAIWWHGHKPCLCFAKQDDQRLPDGCEMKLSSSSGFSTFPFV